MHPLQDIFAILVSCQEKVNSEACWIGAYNKRIVAPESKSDVQIEDLVKQIIVTYNVVTKQFKIVFDFVWKFVNNSYSIATYINMNRMIKAEIDVNDTIKEVTELNWCINFLWF